MSEESHASPNRDVVVTTLENFSSVAVIGGEHSVVVDEPPEFQGDGVGPNPFGLILSALGGCISGTLRGVARQHEFDFDRATVRLSVKVNRPTYGPLDPGERELRIAKIVARVTVHGDLTPEQEKLLVDGVETCPVGNTLRRSLKLVEEVEFVG
jgi:putative redox protein